MKITTRALVVTALLLSLGALTSACTRTPQPDSVQLDTTSISSSSQTTPKDAMNTPEVTELMIKDTTVGEGPAVKTGDTVVVHYTGTLMDGTVFDTSKKRGQPFSFQVGGGMVIQGWEEGLIGMQTGGTRQLTIPPAMAYGPGGVPGVIPPNSPLVFEIELLEIQPANQL